MIEKAALLAFKNRDSIQSQERVGCYHCLETLDLKEIKEYTDDGQTAVCPKCSVDAIVPSVDKSLLEKCREYWFG